MAFQTTNSNTIIGNYNTGNGITSTGIGYIADNILYKKFYADDKLISENYKLLKTILEQRNHTKLSLPEIQKKVDDDLVSIVDTVISDCIGLLQSPIHQNPADVDCGDWRAEYIKTLENNRQNIIKRATGQTE